MAELNLRCDGCKANPVYNRFQINLPEISPKDVKVLLCQDCYKKYLLGTYNLLRSLGVTEHEFENYSEFLKSFDEE